MKINKKKNNNQKKILTTFIVILLVISAFYFSFSSNSGNNNAKLQLPKNDNNVETQIDSAQKPVINSTSQDVKQGGDIFLSISYLSQNKSQGPLIIKSVVETIEGGICKYIITNTNLVRSYSSEALFSGKYYSCNYVVNYEELSKGDWKVRIEFNTEDKNGFVTQDVKIY